MRTMTSTSAELDSGRGGDSRQRAVSRRHAREPRRRRARLDARPDARRARARQGRRDVSERPSAAAGRVSVPLARRSQPRPARRPRASASCSPPTARTNGGSARTPRSCDAAATVVNIDHHHDNSRFGSINLIVDEASSTAEIVRDILRELDVRAHTRDRRGALRRPRHRHRPVPVHEHDAEGAAARRRARGDGRRRARRVPARLRDGAVREAEAARTGARPGIALRGRRPGRLLPAQGRLRRGRRRGAVLRGNHRSSAVGRGLRDGRADP